MKANSTTCISIPYFDKTFSSEPRQMKTHVEIVGVNGKLKYAVAIRSKVLTEHKIIFDCFRFNRLSNIYITNQMI